MSIVGVSEQAVDNVAEQCQDIVEGYVVWRPTVDQYHAIVSALIVKKSPSIDEFRQLWDTDIRMDRETSTITIPARSKMIADDVKEALRSLGRKVGLERLVFLNIFLKDPDFVDLSIKALVLFLMKAELGKSLSKLNILKG